MVGIIGAMQLETRMLKDSITEKEVRTIGGIEFVSGKLENTDVVVAACGVGKVFAAMCAQIMILEYHPDAIINTGVGGGVGEGLHIGDIVIGEKLVQHDMDVCALGCEPGEHMELRRIYFPCAEALVKRIKASADGLGYPNTLGVIASGDQFVSDEDTKMRLRKQFHSLCCEMEGAAVSQVCFVNKVPFVVVRAISDGADGDAKMSFEDFCRMAAERSSRVLHHMLKEKI